MKPWMKDWLCLSAGAVLGGLLGIVLMVWSTGVA